MAAALFLSFMAGAAAAHFVTTKFQALLGIVSDRGREMSKILSAFRARLAPR
jgi:hypothetical protein